MPLFESYDRRIKQINEALAKYGIGSIEEAEQLCPVSYTHLTLPTT